MSDYNSGMVEKETIFGNGKEDAGAGDVRHAR